MVCAQQTGQKVRKKCSTRQRLICTKITSYKIHILDEQSDWFKYSLKMLLKNKIRIQKRFQLIEIAVALTKTCEY